MKTKRKLKKLITSLLCVVMLLGSTMVAQAANVNKTQQEALNWVKSVVGQSLDKDGAYGAQCVDLILAYYDFLGVPRSSGNAVDYITNNVPDGLVRIPGATPQPGDILIYGASNDNRFGHIAIYESDYSTYHQNFNNHQYVEHITSIRYNGFTNPYWGVIRPQFSDTQIPVSFSWSDERCEPDASNVFVYARANANVSRAFTEAGVTIWDESGQVVAQKSENPNHTGTSLEIWYNITNETGVVLQSGTNYTYQIYTVFDGTRYETAIKNFRTTGQANNAWTQNLNITDWTYGTTANTPTAASKYGTPSFTYSRQKEGPYTADVPQNAGTYYVKATVAETGEYKGLETVKEFHINKAEPTYTVPEGLTMTYGNRLESVELPEGFTWYDSTELSGPVSERTAYAIYTPEDTNNYNIAEMVEITITVEPKNLSGMKLTGIDKNTDLDKYVIKDGDNVLVKDTDYKISSKTEGDTVTVTVEFIGNYTGKTQVSYSLKEAEGNATTSNDKTNATANKDTTKASSPKTGDNTFILTWIVLLTAAGATTISILKKRHTKA